VDHQRSGSAVAAFRVSLHRDNPHRGTGSPADLVRSTITSYADQRIQVISHRVRRATLMRIIEKYDLYPRQRKRETSEETLERCALISSSI
jgi:hypothetical protein